MRPVRVFLRVAVSKKGLLPYVTDKHASEFSEEEVREAMRRKIADRKRLRRKK